MALYMSQSILHLARSLYVRPETYGPTYVGSNQQPSDLYHSTLTTVLLWSPQQYQQVAEIDKDDDASIGIEREMHDRHKAGSCTT